MRPHSPRVPFHGLEPFPITEQPGALTDVPRDVTLVDNIQRFLPDAPHSPHPEVLSVADALQEIREEVGDNFMFLAKSRAMRNVRARAELLAHLDVPVLIVGESGAGKEVVARLIHKLSHRSANSFVKVSCAALDPNTSERRLFDEKRSSWSGDPTRGFNPFVLCNNGTVLLDDIDEMTARAQANVACLLQEKHFLSCQAKPVRVDVRILAATKGNLTTALLDGRLRKELYYCLNAFTIQVPPLRERKIEIPLLFTYFMNRAAKTFSLPPRTLSAAALVACREYSWPDNLRELEMFVKRYLVSGEEETHWNFGELNRPQNRVQPDLPTVRRAHLECLPGSANTSLHSVREEAERKAITSVLDQTRWNRRAAARLLHVSYRTLLNKIQQYNVIPK